MPCMPEITILGPFEKLPAVAQRLVGACRQTGARLPASILVAATVDEALFDAVAAATERLVVFPGETSRLTRDQAVSLVGFKNVRRILFDSTPDELPGRADLWSVIKGVYGLLPSIPSCDSVVAVGPREGVLVVTGPDEPAGPKSFHFRKGPEIESRWPDWLAVVSAIAPVSSLTIEQLAESSAVVALQKAQFVVTTTRDSAVATLVAVAAAERGATFLDWSRRLSPLRLELRGSQGRIAAPAEYPYHSLRAVLSQFIATRQYGSRDQPGETMDGAAFLRALGADLDGSVGVGTEASLVRINEVVRYSSLEVVGDTEVLEWRLARGRSRASSAEAPWDQADTIYRRFIERRSFTPEFFRHAHGLSPGFLGAVRRMCDDYPDVCGAAAVGVIDGICDRSLVGWRVDSVRQGLGLLERMGTTREAMPYFALRGGTTLALGNMADAARDWEHINDELQRADMLRIALRYWMPMIEVPSGSRPDRAAMIWWLERMRELRQRNASPSLQQLDMHGLLYLADDGTCAGPFDPAGVETVPAWIWCGCMIHAWMVGRARLLVPMYHRIRDRPCPAAPGEAFLHAVARAVYERAEDVEPVLDELERVCPAQYEEKRPSKPAHFLQALAFRAIGRPAKAEVWIRRAIEHDALAEARRPLIVRAAEGPAPVDASPRS